MCSNPQVQKDNENKLTQWSPLEATGWLIVFKVGERKERKFLLTVSQDDQLFDERKSL